MSKEIESSPPDQPAESFEDYVVGEVPFVPAMRVVDTERVLKSDEDFVQELESGSAAQVISTYHEQGIDAVAFVKDPRKIGFHVFPKGIEPVKATVGLLALGGAVGVGVFAYKKFTAQRHEGKHEEHAEAKPEIRDKS